MNCIIEKKFFEDKHFVVSSYEELPDLLLDEGVGVQLGAGLTLPHLRGGQQAYTRAQQG